MALLRLVRAFCVAMASSLALAAAIASTVSAQQWTVVKEGKFKVEMPGPSEQSVQKVTVNGTGEVVGQIERTVTLGVTARHLRG